MILAMTCFYFACAQHKDSLDSTSRSTLIFKLPSDFTDGKATLLLAENLLDTQVVTIKNGIATFNVRSSFDTTWGLIIFKKDTLYGETGVMIFGSAPRIELVHSGRYLLKPKNNIYAESPDIESFKASMKSIEHRATEIMRMKEYYKFDSLRFDSLSSLMSSHLKSYFALILQYPKDHPKAAYSLFVLTTDILRYSVMTGNVPATVIKESFSSIDQSLQETRTGKAISSKLSRLASIQVGGVLSTFYVVDTAARTVAIPENRFNYTVINLWASWCTACIAHVPEWNSLVKTYTNSRTRFINISIDTDEDSWHSAMRRHSILGQHYLDSKLENKLMNIVELSYIPAYIIIDDKGMILYNYDFPKDPKFTRLKLKLDQISQF